MNPVPMKNFAEVIKGWKTSEVTVQNISSLLKDVGIDIEVVNDSAGFVSNRLSHLFMNEAAALVYEGVATAEQIDNIFKNAFGHKMGPLETADLIGVDTVLDSLKVLYEHYEDSKFRACPLLKQMVYAGTIKVFLSKFVNVNEIEDTDNIFEKGLVNSLFAMNLVTFIEKEFDISIDNTELDLDNFKDINSIVALIENKITVK
jgi:acyl carrier protein